MPRRIGQALAFGGAAAVLGWAGWLSAGADPGAVIGGADVIATVAVLAGLSWASRRIFGPAGAGRAVRIARRGGSAAVLALVAVDAYADRLRYITPPGRSWPAGFWTGQIFFLLVIAAYSAGLFALTAQRRLAGPAALGIGTAAGACAALALYMLPPVGRALHVTTRWVAVVYDGARIAVVLLALGGMIAAGAAAARRTSGRGSRLPLADARARQGAAAGLCAGTAAALLMSILGIATIVLRPGATMRFRWALPAAHVRLQPGSVYGWEVSISHAAAGYLLVLALFPLLGAGLGAWGGLYAADKGRGRPGRPGGGGGGGPRGPEPAPPPSGGQRLGADHQPGILRGYLRELPGLPAAAGAPEGGQVEPERERVPVGAVRG